MNATTDHCETTAKLLTRHWWVLALRGLAAVLFGVIAFAWPAITLLTLILFFSFYALVNGILSFVLAAKTARGFPRFRRLILPGILSIAAGLIAFFTPGLTALALIVVIACWSIVIGIMEIAEAIRLRKEITNEWFLALAGAGSVLFGLAILVWPGAGALALIWGVGAMSILFGILLIAAALRLRHLRGAVAAAV